MHHKVNGMKGPQLMPGKIKGKKTAVLRSLVKTKSGWTGDHPQGNRTSHSPAVRLLEIGSNIRVSADQHLAADIY